MLVLKNTLNLESAERALASLYASPKDAVLAFPTNVRQRELGGEAAFSQFLVTWAQYHKRKSKLSVYVSPQEIDEAKDFVANLPGLIAALSADFAEDHNSKRPVRAELLSASFERLSLLSGPRPWIASKGIGVDLLCVDHFDLGYPPVFYENEKLRGELWFRDVTPLLISQATAAPYRQSIPRKFSQEVGSVIFELVQNTDLHAKTTILGDSVRPSVRGVTIRHRSISRDELIKRAGDDYAFRQYANNLPAPLEGYQNDKFIELSIFDSGPGFASRWTNKVWNDLTLDEEFWAVQSCFERGKTTRRGSRFGQGLPYVIDKLKSLKGLFRIRTGRLSLFADLRDAEIFESGAPKFRDTSGGIVSPRHPVSGALISMFIPVGGI